MDLKKIIKKLCPHFFAKIRTLLIYFYSLSYLIKNGLRSFKLAPLEKNY